MKRPVFSKKDTVMDFEGVRFEFSSLCRDCSSCSLNLARAENPKKKHVSSCSRFSQDIEFEKESGASMPTFMKCEGRDDGGLGVWKEIGSTPWDAHIKRKKKKVKQDALTASIANQILN